MKRVRKVLDGELEIFMSNQVIEVIKLQSGGMGRSSNTEEKVVGFSHVVR